MTPADNKRELHARASSGDLLGQRPPGNGVINLVAGPMPNTRENACQFAAFMRQNLVAPIHKRKAFGVNLCPQPLPVPSTLHAGLMNDLK